MIEIGTLDGYIGFSDFSRLHEKETIKHWLFPEKIIRKKSGIRSDFKTSRSYESFFRPDVRTTKEKY
nr:MAG TPA: hypothetical protein [Bacteriophage sp.]